ncbi:hypothetical protein ABDD95_15195 [Mucilaginibacter sp. PAMB04274]|uniref:hypothetical protein n=1 Tax=Mucilaginibacter sp. PAMB04274 TaxID=3138568 RepID=UPI0031F6A5C8
MALLDDLFLTRHFPMLSSRFTIAPKVIAQHFGAVYQHYPEEALPFNNRNNESLPFGIHSWMQDHQDFLKPCIERHEYKW